jgi:hypothetical protein
VTAESSHFAASPGRFPSGGWHDPAATNRDTARTALEQMCARGDMVLAPSCYAEDFADHFANAEYHGLDCAQRSTELYRALFDARRTPQLRCPAVSQ